MRFVISPYAFGVRLMRRMRFVRDRRGVSAVEFALILPTMIALYLGIAETGNAITVYRRMSAIASTAADLTAQTKTVSTADLDDIVSASSAILSPYPTRRRSRSCFRASLPTRTITARWNGATRTRDRVGRDNSAYPLPAGLTEADSSVIVAEITYAFSPLVDLKTFFSPGSFTMKRTFYARPRRSLTVKKTN